MTHHPLPITHQYSLLTDLYQLTMAACYAGEGIENKSASFELFTRSLPNQFNYLIAMGLEQALDYLENLAFSPEQIQQLKNTGIFDQAPERFWNILETGKFSGEVWAVPEGTAIFPYEPILRVEAPLWQAQLVETYLLNTLNYQTLIATRAARLRAIAGEKTKIIEFGTRRAYSPQASLWAARAALAAGLDSTSNVLAALQLGEKPSGTMAHALVMAFTALSGDEDEAFAAFARYFPQAPLLIDTYDTLDAARRLGEKMEKGESQITGVRLDSGDLVELSQKVRSLLPQAQIFASGDIDEWEIQRLQQAGAKIDGYGVGTKLVTGNPVNGVYKLVELDGIPTRKKSSQKATYPGRKQVFRRGDKDRLGLVNESPQPQETPLLQKVMEQGKRLLKSESLSTIRQRTTQSVNNLPSEVRQLEGKDPFPVEISAALQQLTQET